MQVTGWKSSSEGGTLGLRIGKKNAQRFFPRNWRSVRVEARRSRGDHTDHEHLLDFLSGTAEPFGQGVSATARASPVGSPPKMRLVGTSGDTFVVSLK